MMSLDPRPVVHLAPMREMIKNIQTVQSNTIIQRHDAVPAVAAPVDLVAEADAADVALCEGRG